MKNRIEAPKKILIVGDAGRGKTTLSKRLSERLGIPAYSTDDLYWRVKYTVQEDPEIREEKAKRLYLSPEWIIEGTTDALLSPGYEPSDIILHLRFKNIFVQWIVIIKRSLYRHRNKIDKQTIKGTLLLLRHVAYKRYKLGYKRNDPNYREILRPYKDKVIELHSYKEIDLLIQNLDSRSSRE